ncbi:hypothetical protein [Fibrobacter sp.]|uniref:hypothetical protein n=1 Tax=Fibrobacter sp. TaxID=35828 RepID=UPI0038680E98
MLKKLFLPAAVMAMVFTACDSDSSTSPKTDDQPQGTGTEQSGAINGDANNNTVVKTDPASANASSGAPCTVEKLSANSFIMTMKQDGAVTKVTTTIIGDRAEIDYVSVYDESVPLATVQSLCESNKQEALAEENATVTCEGRTMTAHEVGDAEIGFGGALQSAENACKEMNAYFSDNNPDQTDPGQNTDPVIDNPNQTPGLDQGSGRATCQITENSTNMLKMVAVQPDSGSIYTSYEYKNETLVTEIRFEFLPTVSLSEINEFCAETKADVVDMFEEGAVADVDCDDHSMTTVITEPSSINVLPYLAKEMVEYCNEIQRTGVIPEDDEDDF